MSLAARRAEKRRMAAAGGLSTATADKGGMRGTRRELLRAAAASASAAADGAFPLSLSLQPQTHSPTACVAGNAVDGRLKEPHYRVEQCSASTEEK